MNSPRAEIGIQPVVNWPRQVRAGRSYLITVDLRLTDAAAPWPYEEEEYVVGCMIDGRPTCAVRALGDAGVVLHRFGGSYGPARFLAEVPADRADFTGAALWLTLTTAGGLPFYTGRLPIDGSAVLTEDTAQEATVTEIRGEPAAEAQPVTAGAESPFAGGTTSRQPAARPPASSERAFAGADWSPDGFIVRVLDPAGRPAGLGALIADRRIVTCAHIVNVALGRDRRAQDRPDGIVTVDFPLIDMSTPLTARVVAWVPPPRAGAAGDDVAGLELMDPAPPRAAAARLSVETPRPGRTLRVFGFPATRPRGAWVETRVQGRVGNGRLQLDSVGNSSLKVQPGFSGTPVIDDSTGRVVGIIAEAPSAAASERDSYAITADRLRMAWPEQLSPRPGASVPRTELTILHVSDTQFGGIAPFGGNGPTSAGQGEDVLFRQLHRDLELLATGHGLRPDLMVVTGDLAERGMRSEFRQVTAFLGALAEAAEIPRGHVAIVPGNHDVNRRACQAYFAECEADEVAPIAPYWPKWRQFAEAFGEFYADVPGVTFTPDEPWTLFEMPALNVVVAGLNSTMAESHRDEDHYGWVGGSQLRWFADRLRDHERRGWLRLAAVHHNATRGALLDDENLRDADDLDQILGASGLASLLLQGHAHAHDGQLHYLASGLPVLSSGSAAVTAAARPGEVPNQYELITVRPDGFTRYARQYLAGARRWGGDNRVSATGSDWQETRSHVFSDLHGVFPAQGASSMTREDPAGRASAGRDASIAARDITGFPAPGRNRRTDTFLDLVAEATRVRFPGAIVDERPGGEFDYLRVSRSLESGGAEIWPVGVIDGPVTEDAIQAFNRVHSQFAAADPQVRSELVYRGAAPHIALAELARRHGVRLRSFTDYQGLLDLGPLMNRQRRELAEDRIYPARLYVEQRYRMADGFDVRTDLIRQADAWLSQDGARLVVVLGDFGRGKTAFLRQLARRLTDELPSVLPVLLELRTLEKAPTLDELLAQHLVRQGVADVSPRKLRYMIESGRLALLFDGFDELELRVGYDNAADYLRTLLDGVAGQAKVILTSRTQHFRSTDQVRTELGATIEVGSASRVVILEDFAEEQILQFLGNFYGDGARAAARFELFSDIPDLLGLVRNPRMLAFVAALDEDRLISVRRRGGTISLAGLYREIIDSWLNREADRQRYDRGLASLTMDERLAACTALALRLWASTSLTIDLSELSAQVAATLSNLAERGYTVDQASHAIASGSLLVRADDGGFAFIDRSIMEWLVADAAARHPESRFLATRRMSRLMIGFLTDLAGPDAALGQAYRELRDPEANEVAKQNALGVTLLVRPADIRSQAGIPERLPLAGVDLRDMDLSNADLSGADLRGAVLRGMRLTRTDLSGADLSDADFTGARVTDGAMTSAVLSGSHWDGAAIANTRGIDGLASPELDAAAVVGRDPAEPVLNGDASLSGVAFSPDGILIATASSDGTARIWDTRGGVPLAALTGHRWRVTCVAFSPDGTVVATASEDGTARTWDTRTGTPRTTFTGHDQAVNGVAFSPDGIFIGTASADGTARIWDAATGTPQITLTVHREVVWRIAFSPDGSLIGTASSDGTARIWDAATRTLRVTLTEQPAEVWGLAFSPDGALIATASSDGTVRTWNAATGIPLTTLNGHTNWVNAVTFSPDGSLIATASEDHTARTWDAATGTPRATLTGHTNWVNAAAFSPDGALIATASADGTARIWDAATGAGLATLIPLPAGGYATLLPGGGYKLAGDPADRLWWTIKLCRFEPGELDAYVPEIRRLPPDAPILPGR